MTRRQLTHERDQIRAAADKGGDRWLMYMALYGEPAITPDSWERALAKARRVNGGAA